jgi:hypothetical protein
MDAPSLALLLLVIVVGLPAAVMSRTALALVGSYAVLEGCWAVTEQSSMLLEIVCDYIVLLVVFLHDRPQRSLDFPNLREQFFASWRSIPVTDWIVVALFPCMWVLYSAPLSDSFRWWGLWWAFVGQLVAGGIEGWNRWAKWFRFRAGSEKPPGALMFATRRAW